MVNSAHMGLIARVHVTSTVKDTNMPRAINLAIVMSAIIRVTILLLIPYY